MTSCLRRRSEPLHPRSRTARRALAVAMALSPATLASCGTAGPAILSATEMGVLEQSPLIVGRDGGGSARVFGRSIWVYGDTVTSVPDVQQRTWHHNSFSWTVDDNAADAITGFVEPLDAAGAPAYYIPPSPYEQAFNDDHYGDSCRIPPCGERWAVWAGAPLWDASRGEAFVRYAVVGLAPEGQTLHGGGTSVARWRAFDQPIERPVVRPGTDHPDLLWTEDEPGWGTAGVIQSGFLYLFACGNNAALTRPCRIARALTDQCQQRNAWTYWDGDRWTADMRTVATLFDGGDIMEVSWNDYLNAWLAVYTPPLDRTIYARTAPALTGPWSERAALYTVSGPDAPYDGLNHPEFAEDRGRVQYLTYSRPTTGWFGRELVVVRVVLR